MARCIWRLQLAFLFLIKATFGVIESWKLSGYLIEYYYPDSSPSEAFLDEVSYWE
jgi:hypothetical protein